MTVPFHGLRRLRFWHEGAALLLAACVMAFTPMAGHATQWQPILAESRIAFSGTHAGRAFEGTFKSWSADITFDPDDLANAKAVVSIDLASAHTGDLTYDKTLPTSDWFDVGKAEEGRFVTSTFKKVGEDAFEADGVLTVRGFEVPVTLAFTFKREGGSARLTGTTRLDRLAFAIGKSSDESGAWVSLEIPVSVDVRMKAMQ